MKVMLHEHVSVVWIDSTHLLHWKLSTSHGPIPSCTLFTDENQISLSARRLCESHIAAHRCTTTIEIWIKKRQKKRCVFSLILEGPFKVMPHWNKSVLSDLRLLGCLHVRPWLLSFVELLPLHKRNVERYEANSWKTKWSQPIKNKIRRINQLSLSTLEFSLFP